MIPRTISNEVSQPTRCTAITPSDATDLSKTASKGIFVSVPAGASATVYFKLIQDSASSSYVVLQGSQYLPGRFSRVMSTNTVLNGSTIISYGD